LWNKQNIPAYLPYIQVHPSRLIVEQAKSKQTPAQVDYMAGFICLFNTDKHQNPRADARSLGAINGNARPGNPLNQCNHEDQMLI
jgi:hypothetical protein